MALGLPQNLSVATRIYNSEHCSGNRGEVSCHVRLLKRAAQSKSASGQEKLAPDFAATEISQRREFRKLAE